MDERIGFGLYQSCGDRGSAGYVSVFWLWWGGVSLDYLCRWQVQVSVLCLADTCTSEVHPVFNPVEPYGYLLSDMYLFMADIPNPDFLV